MNFMIQRDPLQRALSSSISFGRFMSESLDWEKWSAFTHNRYLEEVEKYKRPGSVAEKKAYFEARYKRRKAEALLEQDNEACTDLPQLNETNENQDNSSSDSESAQKNGNVVTGITKKDDVQNSEVTVLEGISEDAESSVKKSSNKLEIERDIGNIMPNKADNTQEKVCVNNSCLYLSFSSYLADVYILGCNYGRFSLVWEKEACIFSCKVVNN